MTDRTLVRHAVEALTDGNQSLFGRLLGLTPDNVNARLAGRKSITEMERRLYRTIIDDPAGSRARYERLDT